MLKIHTSNTPKNGILQSEIAFFELQKDHTVKISILRIENDSILSIIRNLMHWLNPGLITVDF